MKTIGNFLFRLIMLGVLLFIAYELYLLVEQRTVVVVEQNQEFKCSDIGVVIMDPQYGVPESTYTVHPQPQLFSGSLGSVEVVGEVVTC